MATLNQSSYLASRIMQAVPLFGGWDARPIWFTDDDAWTAWVGITTLARAEEYRKRANRPQHGSGPLPAPDYRNNGTCADAARVALESYVADLYARAEYIWSQLPQRGSGPIPALGYRDNGTRADAARVALESYVATNTPQYANEPLEEKVSDLLCDLLHLVRRDGTEGEIIDGEPQSDPTDLLDRARDNFEEEEAEEEDAEVCECGRYKRDCLTFDEPESDHGDR